jgi:hypothetical protein
MPHRGMRTTHSPCAGVIDRAHQQQRQPIRRWQAKPVRHFSRRDGQSYRPPILFVYRFFENTIFKRPNLLSHFRGYADCRREIWIAVGIDGPHFVAAMRQQSRQDAGDRRLPAPAFTSNRDFNPSTQLCTL